MKRLVFVLALAAMVPPVSANVSSSATLSNIGVTLFDLDPNDGVAAAITFNSAADYHSHVGTSVGETFARPPSLGDEHYATGSSNFAPVSISSSLSSATTSAEISSGGTLGTTVLHASGSTAPLLGVDIVFYYGGASILRNLSNAYIAQAFSLSPHTRAVFSADAILSTTISAGVPPIASMIETAIAYAQLSVFEQGIGYNIGPQASFDDANLSLYWDGTFGSGGSLPIRDEMQRSVSVSFENTTADDLSGAFNVSANVSGHSYYYAVPAVPEPSIALSLLCGVFVVGWRLRSPRARRGV